MWMNDIFSCPTVYPHWTSGSLPFWCAESEKIRLAAFRLDESADDLWEYEP
jgi:hypothetical protein